MLEDSFALKPKIASLKLLLNGDKMYTLLSTYNVSGALLRSTSQLLAVVLSWGQLWELDQHPCFTAEELRLRQLQRVTQLGLSTVLWVLSALGHCALQPVGPGSIL